MIFSPSSVGIDVCYVDIYIYMLGVYYLYFLRCAPAREAGGFTCSSLFQFPTPDMKGSKGANSSLT